MENIARASAPLHFAQLENISVTELENNPGGFDGSNNAAKSKSLPDHNLSYRVTWHLSELIGWKHSAVYVCVCAGSKCVWMHEPKGKSNRTGDCHKIAAVLTAHTKLDGCYCCADGDLDLCVCADRWSCMQNCESASANQCRPRVRQVWLATGASHVRVLTRRKGPRRHNSPNKKKRKKKTTQMECRHVQYVRDRADLRHHSLTQGADVMNPERRAC